VNSKVTFPVGCAVIAGTISPFSAAAKCGRLVLRAAAQQLLCDARDIQSVAAVNDTNSSAAYRHCN